MDYPRNTPGAGLVDGRFVDENPATGQPGSLIPAAWGNSVTDELLAVIKSAGLAPSEEDRAQLVKAIQIIAASDMKRSVRVATTAPIALSGTQQIGGVQLVAGDRALVKNQADASLNGIYVVAAGVWARATDADASAKFSPGHMVVVQSGALAGTGWQLTNESFPIPNVTAINYGQVFGKTGVVAGTYRSVSIDAQGRVTAGTNPDTLGGYGIQPASQVEAETGGDNAKPMTALRTHQAIDKKVAAIDPWALQPMGVPIAVFSHIAGVSPIPTNKTYRYVTLTANDPYNAGMFSSESVAGTAPLVVASAVIGLAGSPLLGAVISLINTERRSLRPGSPGSLEFDALQAHRHRTVTNTTDRSAAFAADGSETFQSISAQGAGQTNAYRTLTGPVLDEGVSGGSATIRSANETRIKSIGVTYYMRIK
ncbi:hypothetical protein [Pseudomonas mosselii]|uniref:hypothetical protein n=1 Tax=Pseudomonas mosselii TaxID=78327 RepID=UPI002163A608|nr:hypothetical protein [Pseudomonas mosselii]UVN46249.1 hypothetical protein NW905_09700 [Pseudomonas mosselii]